MTFYKEEKKRIGNGRWAIIIAILTFHFGRIQGQMNGINLYGGDMFYAIDILLLGIFLLIGYLDERLFFVKEQEKRVYIIRKYEILPIRTKTIYFAKIRIMVETLVVLLIGAVGIYGVTVVANQQKWCMQSLASGFLISVIFAFGLMSVVVIVEGLYQENKKSL